MSAQIIEDLDYLKKIAVETRIAIIEMVHMAASGHVGGALGMTDIFTALYFNLLKHDPQKPTWPERDYLLLSNGHICPVLYATLAKASYFKKDLIYNFRKTKSTLQGHPHYQCVPGVEITSGSLGQGLSQACGLALSLKMDQLMNKVFCVISDAEQQEGQTWEALMFAAHKRLDNLIIIVDRNNLQISGQTEKIMGLEPLKEKYLSFGLAVLEMNGHDFKEILKTINQAKKIVGQPIIIIAKTVLGKGVSFMENNSFWHGQAPNKEEAQQALKELRKDLLYL